MTGPHSKSLAETYPATTESVSVLWRERDQLLQEAEAARDALSSLRQEMVDARAVEADGDGFRTLQESVDEWIGVLDAILDDGDDDE